MLNFLHDIVNILEQRKTPVYLQSTTSVDPNLSTTKSQPTNYTVEAAEKDINRTYLGHKIMQIKYVRFP